MKQITLLAAGLFIAFSACKKNKEEEAASLTAGTPAAPASVGNYSQLSVGNYWIYEEFTVDTLGNATPNGHYDSCYVERDTVIHSNTYYKLVRPTSVPVNVVSFLRDSSSYVVNEHGTIFFSLSDFTNLFNHKYYIEPAPLNDTLYESYGQMFTESSPAIVPAGAFTVLNYKTTYRMYGAAASVAGRYRYAHARYCNNIGLVSETLPFFLSSPNHTEIRLLRYHLN